MTNNLQVKRGVKCPLLYRVAITSPSRHVFALAGVVAASLTIMNVIKCGIYSRVATILFRSSLSAASI